MVNRVNGHRPSDDQVQSFRTTVPPVYLVHYRIFTQVTKRQRPQCTTRTGTHNNCHTMGKCKCSNITVDNSRMSSNLLLDICRSNNRIYTVDKCMPNNLTLGKVIHTYAVTGIVPSHNPARPRRRTTKTTISEGIYGSEKSGDLSTVALQKLVHRFTRVENGMETCSAGIGNIARDLADALLQP